MVVIGCGTLAAALAAAEGPSGRQKREFDGSEFQDPPIAIFASGDPRLWQKDPIGKLAPALGAGRPLVTPFLIDSADAFRPGGGKVPKIYPWPTPASLPGMPSIIS